MTRHPQRGARDRGPRYTTFRLDEIDAAAEVVPGAEDSQPGISTKTVQWLNARALRTTTQTIPDRTA